MHAAALTLGGCSLRAVSFTKDADVAIRAERAGEHGRFMVQVHGHIAFDQGRMNIQVRHETLHDAAAA